MTAGSSLGSAPRAAMNQLRLHQATVEKAVLTRLSLRLGISLQASVALFLTLGSSFGLYCIFVEDI